MAPASGVGGGLIAGAYWLAVAWLLHHGQLQQRPATGRMEPAAA